MEKNTRASPFYTTLYILCVNYIYEVLIKNTYLRDSPYFTYILFLDYIYDATHFKNILVLYYKRQLLVHYHTTSMVL